MKPRKPPPPPPTPTRPEPTPQMIARVAEAKRRNGERHERPSVKLKLNPKPNGKGIVSEITASRDVRETLLDAFGTKSMDFVTAELEHLSNCQRGGEPSGQEQRNLNAAIAVIDGTRPENEAAAMLASQMAATHPLAMDMLGRARRAQTVEQLHAYGSFATKLLRTYTMQIEALAKLKRGGEQTVRVEHVHVYPGGQAIVGVARKGGGNNEKDRQTHETINPRALAFAPGDALLGEDPGRDAVPAGVCEGQEAVQAPWRR